jgi:hypothetical protein
MKISILNGEISLLITGECVERKETLSLPAGMEAAFLTPRKESLSFWLKIGRVCKGK